jgi:putative ABC transport system substrate-binding protein
MKRRRAFLIAAAGAFATSRLSFGQTKPPKLARVGVLDNASGAMDRAASLRDGLRELGYVEGKNVAIEYREAEGSYERLPGLVADLLQRKVDVIVAFGTLAIQAARKATTTVPIVMAATADPVGAGFVASLAHPGGNVTGLTNISVDVSSKYLELLRVAVPKLSRAAVLVNPVHPNHPDMLKSIHAAARKEGISVDSLQAGTDAQLEAAFVALTRTHAGALVVLPDGFLRQQARRIAEFAVKNRLPTMYWARELAEAGGLMSYGQDLVEHYRRAATYVDKILKGAKPRDLPVEQPTKVELVINLRTAKAIGLTIPQDLLFRADKVIE